MSKRGGRNRGRTRRAEEPHSKSELALLDLLKQQGPMSVMQAARAQIGNDDEVSVRIVSKRLHQLKVGGRVTRYTYKGVERFEVVAV